MILPWMFDIWVAMCLEIWYMPYKIATQKTIFTQ